MKKRIIIIASILGILLGAYLIVNNVRGKDSKIEVIVGCTSCGKIYGSRKVPEDNYPLKCKFCKKKSVYKMLKCYDCGKIIYLDPDFSGSCPECGSRYIKQLKDVPQ